MPELPEVETALRGIAPYLTGALNTALVVRERRLRWPIPLETDALVPGQRIRSLRRRAKYLLGQPRGRRQHLHGIKRSATARSARTAR